MSDPIPYDVLRYIAAHGFAAGQAPDDGRDLARELLALRDAARVVVSGDAWSGADGASLGVQADRLFAARAALRALLPEEPM